MKSYEIKFMRRIIDTNTEFVESNRNVISDNNCFGLKYNVFPAYSPL